MKFDVVDKTISLYTDVGWKKWFSKVRFWDAPYNKIEKLIPKRGTILDLGCGEGIFTNFLAVASKERRLIGIDIDADRIKEADRGLKNVLFKKRDATKLKIRGYDVVVMFHLLHHLTSFSEQGNLIRKVFKSIKSGGKLIVIEVDKEPFLKFLISWFTDHFIVAWLFEKKIYEGKIYFRDRKDWMEILTNCGFSCRVVKADKGKPFSHIVFVCQKE